MTDSSNYSVIFENGVGYIPVRKTTDSGDALTWEEFYYILENPVTTEEPELDEDNNPVLDENGDPILVYVNSKLTIQFETVEFLLEGGGKAERTIDGKLHWLLKLPNNFVIETAYQPDNMNPRAEQWSIGGTDDSIIGVDKRVYPFIPKRAFEYVGFTENPGGGYSPKIVYDAMVQKIYELLHE